MSKVSWKYSTSSTGFVELIHVRLKEELDRLGLKPAAAAKLAGEPDSQGLRDVLGGRKRLSADLLAALTIAAGVDATYVLTGGRKEPAEMTLTPDEHELVERFRAAPLSVKGAAIGALSAGSKPPTGSKFSIDFGQATIGQNNTVSGGKHKFKVTTPSRKK
ncbi:hypothetical protein ACV22X_22030 [Burkholderia orbicola]